MTLVTINLNLHVFQFRLIEVLATSVKLERLKLSPFEMCRETNA